MTRKHPGKVVAERFEVERIAGSGGMGVVYQAHDRATGRAVALKVLLERDQGPTERFAHEIQLLSTLDHPHIVGYVSHGTTEEGSPYLVMPWLQGMDLQERLRAGPLSIAETLALARDVADALACLHGRGLVHRDLKPSNLFLPDGKVENVQMIDLGVARASVASHALTLSGVLIGTPGFIAPEQARGDREIAPAVDVFAFGCVLFECLTGRRLFTGSHLMSVLAKILLEDAPRTMELRPEVPPALDLLVHRMVSKDPEKRPRDGAELAARLADLERIPALGVRSPSPPPSLTESERRVVTVLVVVLPATAGAIDPGPDETRPEADPLHALSVRFGVRAHLLAERMAIVLAPERASAADQAAVLARFARHAVQSFRGARIALTTGSAITGARLPVGEAIERAVTMVRTVTEPLGVQIDDVTAALITSRFDIRREAGTLVVEDERLSLDPARPLLGRPTSCVGRERELALLEATFAECADGEGPKVVLVTAAAGTGKSRLRHEFVRRLIGRSSAPRVLQSRGDPLHMTTPYALIAQAVRQAADLREREPAETIRARLWDHVVAHVPAPDVTRVTNFLGELIDAKLDDRGDLPLRAARHDAAAMADQIARAFEDILRTWCVKQSLVLLVEDLHWGDAASIKLLDRALRKLAGADLFVLAMARPEVHERFPTLFQNRDVTEVRLPPIPKRACARLVHEVMGERADAAEVGRIVERSEGNGFYLEELIRAEAEKPRRPSGAHTPSSHPDSLPDTVIAVAQARLERLEPSVRRVLRAASVFGDVFWFEGVSALVGEGAPALRPVIASLVEQEAIVPSEQPRIAGVQEFSFRHALLRATAYATLTDDDRALGHRLAAQWLDEVQEDGEAVAVHWLEGGDRGRAAASFFRAGTARWSRAQADAAARCATRALLVGGGEEETDAIAARVRLLAMALDSCRTLDAREVIAGLEHHVRFDVGVPRASPAIVTAGLERSLRRLRAADPQRALPVILSDGACALGALSDFVGARKLLAEATAAVAGEEARHPSVRYASAKVAFWAGEAGAALELLADTILPEDPRARIQILLILASAVVMAEGRPALGRGLDFVSRAEATLHGRNEGDLPPDSRREDPVALVRCAKARGACFHFAGEYALGAEAEAAVVALARRSGLRFDESAHLHNAGEQYLRLGDRDRARAAILESQVIARDIGAERSQKHNEMLLAYLDGRADRLVEMAERSRGTGDRWFELYARYWLGILLAPSTATDARRALERALEIARDLKVRTAAEDCNRAIAALAPKS